MKVLRIQFKNNKGEALSARMTMPANGQPQHFAIIAHCFTCNKNFNSVRNISNALTAAGFGAFSFDYTGLGNSKGNFADTNFSTNVEDVLAAAAYLKEKYSAPKLIVGHSFGGPAAIYAAAALESVLAVATIAAPSEIKHIKHLLESEMETIKKEGIAKLILGGTPITIKEQFIEDLSKHDLPEVVRNLRKPILIMHSPTDNTVSINHAENLYMEAKHPKSFVSLAGTDHLLNNKKDATYAGEVIAAWVKNYLPTDLKK